MISKILLAPRPVKPPRIGKREYRMSPYDGLGDFVQAAAAARGIPVRKEWVLERAQTIGAKLNCYTAIVEGEALEMARRVDAHVRMGSVACLGQVTQLVVPLSLERISHQAVARVNQQEAALREIRFNPASPVRWREGKSLTPDQAGIGRSLGDR